MASSRDSKRPVALSMQPNKPVISVEEWEHKAPLDDIALRSVNAVKLACEQKPLPSKYGTSEAGPSSRPGTPQLAISRSLKNGSSRPSTPVNNPLLKALHPAYPVQTPQQFFDWFSLIERSVAHSQESHFRAHVAGVAGHLEACQFILQRINEIEEEVKSMQEGWRGVEESGRSLKEACERLLEEREALLTVTEEIEERLEYFKELESAVRILNAPGDTLIFQPEFLEMVERVDICIEFLKAHRHYRESELYLLRFQQCMTRSMTLIKMNFVGSLWALTADVSKRLSEKSLSQMAQYHLLYPRFRTVSSKISLLLGELETRARRQPDEFLLLLSECRTAYFTARKRLLIPRLKEEIEILNPIKTDVVELTRAGCGYIRQLCTDEFNLYRSFFSTDDNMLYEYLEILCDLLYDDLRPRIFHEQRLPALCEVCAILQALMVIDISESPPLSQQSSSESDASDSEDDDDELNLDLNSHDTNNLSRLQISRLLQTVLQDAQTRLFFKAQSVIQNEVRNYFPKHEDLDYPAKLLDVKNSSMKHPTTAEKDQMKFKLTSIQENDTWYPTISKTKWVLEQLHDFIKPAIYEDIAQEALTLCRMSLVSAAESMKGKSLPDVKGTQQETNADINQNGSSASLETKKLDAALFLVRHLLILRDLANEIGMDVQSSDDAAQPPKAKNRFFNNVESQLRGGGAPDSLANKSIDTLTNMFNRTTSLLPESLFASLGIRGGPNPAADNLKGAKFGIDNELRHACEDVIIQCIDPICESLRVWADQVNAATSPPVSISTEKNPITSPTTIQADLTSLPPPSSISKAFVAALESDLRARVRLVQLYLTEPTMVRVLLGHIGDRVVSAYADFVSICGLWEGVGGNMKEEQNIDVENVMQVRELVRRICEEKQ